MPGMIAEGASGTRPSRDDLSDEYAERLVVEIHRVLQDTVQPHRPPTADELRERAGRIVGMMPELLEEGGLSEEEAFTLMKLMLSRILEAHFAERIAGTLAEASPFRHREGRGFGRFTHFALSDG